ncbi:GRIP and coiled-coil domain-containing protein 2-like protein [Leptotrombidium deliense]|uniref:GRIP and coiled-coil domain-containing protein 2-like protein n=1 Tax=Leptotrombidium deliense TaxID=299467 RepID=A0A443S898_9ACAR|nr:GRIP and coiled-coil domain-containing protein 2-like protein [Leptotrombidium deliense]
MEAIPECDENKDTINVCKDNLTSKSCIQHDLEKLQESHDVLMHQLEEKSSLLEKLHVQFDRSLETKEELEQKLSEKDNELVAVEEIIKQKDARIKQLEENEVKMNKVKALAVKLKKELAEANEELRIERSIEKDSKEVLRQLQKEKEKIAQQYSQSVKNFQNLQSEYDLLHDQFDDAKKQLKTKEADLSSSIKTATSLKEELEESKNEIERLKAEIGQLRLQYDDECSFRRDLESKLIIFDSELDEQRKRATNSAGLEQSVINLKKQLDLKTTEVVELGEQVETLTVKLSECDELKQTLENLIREKEDLAVIKDSLQESVTDITSKMEKLNSSYEQEKIQNIEFIEQNTSLRLKLQSTEEQSQRKVKNLEQNIKELKTQIELSEEELKRKEDDFNAYKLRVCKVLSEKKENPFEMRVKVLEEECDTLKSELQTSDSELKNERDSRSKMEDEVKKLRTENKSLSEELTKLVVIAHENESLKSLSRDLQCKLVSEKKDFTSKLKEIEEKRVKEVEDLKERINSLQSEIELSKASSKQSSNSDSPTMVCNNGQNSADNTDLESVETTSLPETHQSKARSTRLSNSSYDHTVNPLEEILFPKKTDDVIERELQQLNELKSTLEETETNNILLSEQNKVLKEEIRRLERNLQRVEIAENLEYLKNVLMKFLSLEGCNSERLQLVPVLKTILKLNMDEEQLLLHLNGFMQTQSKESANWSKLLWNGFN